MHKKLLDNLREANPAKAGEVVRLIHESANKGYPVSGVKGFTQALKESGYSPKLKQSFAQHEKIAHQSNSVDVKLY